MLLLACTDYNLAEKPDPNLEPGPVLEISPRELDFGEQLYGSQNTQTITLKNVGDETVDISRVSLEGVASYTLLEDITGELASTKSKELHIAFLPQAPDNTAQAVFWSNDKENPAIPVDLYGKGQVPLLLAEPGSVDFGIVPLNDYRTQEVVLTNIGYAELSIASTTLTGSWFGLHPPDNTTLGAGESTTLTVDFASDFEGNFAEALWIDSNSIAGPLQIPIQAAVASTPVAVCYGSPDPAIPGETLWWLGEDSYDNAGREIVVYEWSLTGRPAGSKAAMSASGPNRSMLLDLAGSYRASLTVTNDQGIVSEVCEATIEAVPLQDLWVELFWTVAEDDLDLHLWMEGQEPYTAGDCYFGNCRNGLEWGVADFEEDDPFLDLDDIYEIGPENINILHPAEGSFMVGVNDFWGHWEESANIASVNVYIYGSLAWSGSRELSGDDTMTEFVKVTFPDGAVEER